MNRDGVIGNVDRIEEQEAEIAALLVPEEVGEHIPSWRFLDDGFQGKCSCPWRSGWSMTRHAAVARAIEHAQQATSGALGRGGVQ